MNYSLKYSVDVILKNRFPPIKLANIEWNEKGEAQNTIYHDRYFADDAINESRYVYLEGNSLQQRWQNSEGDSFTILEIGFGSGLNFLLTWQLWQQSKLHHNNNIKKLIYISIEKHPVARKDLKKFYLHWPELKTLSSDLLNRLPIPSPGRHLLQISSSPDMPVETKTNTTGSNIDLILMYQTAEIALQQLVTEGQRVDAIYLDGFAPGKNSSCWQPAIMENLYKLSNNNCTIATFSAASMVRKNLQSAGFDVSRRNGYGRKREMLTAISKSILPSSSKKKKAGADLHNEQTVAIIGAGLAGTILAAKLSSRGFAVDVFEAGPEICNQASGNDYGLVYPKLSNIYDYSCQLNIYAFSYLINELIEMDDQSLINPETVCNHPGLLYQLTNNSQNRLKKTILDQLNIPDEYMELITGNNHDHLLMKQAGAISPRKLSQSYLNSKSAAKIKFYFNKRIHFFDVNKGLLHIVDSDRTHQQTYNKIILCNGAELPRLFPDLESSLVPVRGQIDLIKFPQRKMNQPICGNGYLIPVKDAPSKNNSISRAWVGASFRRNDSNTEISKIESLENVTKATQLLGSDLNSMTVIKSRAATRLTSKDRMPISGLYASSSSTQKKPLCELYIHSAFGSHGMTLIPLLSENLTRLIANENLILEPYLISALSPERFRVKKKKD